MRLKVVHKVFLTTLEHDSSQCIYSVQFTEWELPNLVFKLSLTKACTQTSS